MTVFQPIVDALRAAYPHLRAEHIGFGQPPKLEMGDVALPLFLAAKHLGTLPPRLAAEMAAGVSFGPLVREARAAGPYLNLKLDRGAFIRAMVAEVLRAGARFGARDSGAGRRMLIEHTSINPNASPHVGRARNAMVGDSLTRLFRFEGYAVEVHYYVNDIGKQIGLLVLMADEIENLEFKQVLEAYVAANARAEQDEAFAAAGYALLAKMEEGDAATAEKFRRVVDLCLAGQLAVLGRLGAQYDVFDRESTFLSDPRLAAVEEALRAKDALFTDEEQRLVVDLAKLGHESEAGRYFVLRRANGSSMYGYRDLAYTMEKMSRGAEVNLIVLGEDHKLYFQQLCMILAAAGMPAPEPVYYSYILLRSGKMSTRQGKVVLLSDFLDEAEARAAERVAEQCKELSGEEQATIARQIAVGAIRFAVLRVNASKNVTFDLESALSFSGDTGPYLQYCCARIRSILRKHDAPLPPTPSEHFPAVSDAEWLLAMKISAFPEVVAAAMKERNTAPIAVYALELAHLFTGFYHDCPVLTAETDALREARLLLCQATLQTMQNALGILGIEAPERM